jgi:hypothetical protein
VNSMSSGEYKLVLVRKGGCLSCGFCCGFVNGRVTEGSCPHLTPLGRCAIWDKREFYCPTCGHDHKNCIEAPKYPMRKLNPKCGYRFYDAESGAEVINVELADWEFVSKHG